MSELELELELQQQVNINRIRKAFEEEEIKAEESIDDIEELDFNVE